MTRNSKLKSPTASRYASLRSLIADVRAKGEPVKE